uniref:Uncharacterized protein n=1 Tax=Fagus sylvatica TaxID=28930 RepID=A0A2N9FFY9_FAGSY
MWPDSRGVLWRDVLRENARKEFEDARFESDPEIVTRLLIGGRDAVQSALDKLAEKQREQIDKERGGGDQRPVSEYAGTVGVDLAVPATPAGCMSMADVFKL